MNSRDAIASLGALAQETRLAAYRLLVQRGPTGASAGEIAEALEVPSSSLSFHLQQLVHAGLIHQERRSRQMLYRANYDRMNGLVAFLTENCCGQAGASGRCEPAPAAKRGGS